MTSYEARQAVLQAAKELYVDWGGEYCHTCDFAICPDCGEFGKSGTQSRCYTCGVANLHKALNEEAETNDSFG